MPDTMFPVKVVRGVPVVVTPEEVDIVNAAELRAALIPAAELRLAGSRRVGATSNGSGIAAIGLAMLGRRERAGRHRLDQFA
jgi:hypothetical protein